MEMYASSYLTDAVQQSIVFNAVLSIQTGNTGNTVCIEHCNDHLCLCYVCTMERRMKVKRKVKSVVGRCQLFVLMLHVVSCQVRTYGT